MESKTFKMMAIYLGRNGDAAANDDVAFRYLCRLTGEELNSAGGTLLEESSAGQSMFGGWVIRLMDTDIDYVGLSEQFLEGYPDYSLIVIAEESETMYFDAWNVHGKGRHVFGDIEGWLETKMQD